MVLVNLESSRDFGRLALSSRLFSCTAYRRSLKNLSTARKLLTSLSCFEKAEGGFPVGRAEPRFPLARAARPRSAPLAVAPLVCALPAALRGPRRGREGKGRAPCWPWTLPQKASASSCRRVAARSAYRKKLQNRPCRGLEISWLFTVVKHG